MPETTEAPRFMTLKAAANFLGLNLSYVQRMSAEGRLPGKVSWGPHVVRVDRLVLEEHLAEMIGNGHGT